MDCSISDIAKIANVSPTTVSRALNNNGYVNESTKQRILDAAKEMGYAPKKYRKRRNSVKSSSIIGVVVPDIQNPYFGGIIQGIEAVAIENGYELFVCNSGEDSGREICCLSALHGAKVCGLIVAAASDFAEYNKEYLKQLNDSGIPVVLVDRDLRIQGIDSVIMDNYHGAKNAVNILLTNGHTEVAILSGPILSPTGVDRLNGYIQAMKDHNLPIREENIRYGDFRAKSGYEMTKKLLGSGTKATAIFSANHQMMLGCLRAIQEKGMKIPDDISVFSFGMSDPLTEIESGISYVYQPSPPLGEESARILLSKVESGRKHKKQPSKQTVFSTECCLLGSEVFPVNRKK